MAKKAENRIVIDMACATCRSRNYTTTKNRKNTVTRLELRKFCSHCRQHTVHREQR
ncbi:MAG: 50S ribosomal protein L33 [Chloroflexi bacterium]|nr:50S ribosomal protein L33 [Chloroflexota bacterium]MCL4545724.1 50S ribosomal protein L33 [Chloroflexota bacterium]